MPEFCHSCHILNAKELGRVRKVHKIFQRNPQKENGSDKTGIHAANLGIYQGKCMSPMDNENHSNNDGLDKFPAELVDNDNG